MRKLVSRPSGVKHHVVMADQWHYQFVSLLAKNDPDDTEAQVKASIAAVKNTVGNLGLEGWEAVGQVSISTTHHAGAAGGTVRIKHQGLLMKRPATPENT